MANWNLATGHVGKEKENVKLPETRKDIGFEHYSRDRKWIIKPSPVAS